MSLRLVLVLLLLLLSFAESATGTAPNARRMTISHGRNVFLPVALIRCHPNRRWPCTNGSPSTRGGNFFVGSSFFFFVAGLGTAAAAPFLSLALAAEAAAADDEEDADEEDEEDAEDKDATEGALRLWLFFLCEVMSDIALARV